MNPVLIVAFHFPPYGTGSGILRILKFCRYLPEFDWQPVVLTANTRAYERIDPSLLRDIPPSVPVVRAFALDTQRHLSIKNRYLLLTALPDRWATWFLPAVAQGLSFIRKKRVKVIFSTYPIATAVLIGLALHKLTGLPWVVDFRDSMTEDDYPRDPLVRRISRWIEKKAVANASRLIFTAASTLDMYRKRYPSLPAEKCLLISNGYDEEDFHWLAKRSAMPESRPGPVRLLHLGVIYPSERDPRPFFRAVARWKKDRPAESPDPQISLRASGSEDFYVQILRELKIDDVIHLLPSIAYPEALREAAASDGLLLFQAANCDHQIPAKVYEYLRIGKPILALTTQTGDTAALLKETGGATIVDLADEQAIYEALPVFLNAVRSGKHSIADLDRVEKYNRRNQAGALAACLSTLACPTSELNENAARPATLAKIPASASAPVTLKERR
jgi:glycosyltransferase involved in cell wall biosynthesis